VGSLTMADRVAKKLFYHQDHFYYVKLASLEQPKASDFAKHRESVARSVDSSYQQVVIGDWLAKLKKESTIQTSKKVASATADPQ